MTIIKSQVYSSPRCYFSAGGRPVIGRGYHCLGFPMTQRDPVLNQKAPFLYRDRIAPRVRLVAKNIQSAIHSDKSSSYSGI